MLCALPSSTAAWATRGVFCFMFCFGEPSSNRGRLAEKRTIPLPPNRVPKKELASIFSSDDSEGSERASGDHAHIKQEEDLHYSIMRKK
ncbi:hypothetical protein GOODEAATRI_002488 [Goodea atripinnis]|uniref:Secreted protein n=2 Tax=Goodeidae TaxID=28758 RepID=A0ABV0MNR1_9TELE